MTCFFENEKCKKINVCNISFLAKVPIEHPVFSRKESKVSVVNYRMHRLVVSPFSGPLSHIGILAYKKKFNHYLCEKIDKREK